MTVSGDLDPPTSRRARRAEDAGLFRLLVDRVVDYAIFLLTPDGHVASWNAGAERLAAEEQLRQSEERFRTLVASVKDYAIFLLSPEGRILTWNEGAARIKGYAPDEIIGQSFKRFYTAEDRAAGLPARLLATARAEGRVEHEGWRVRKDGSRFWADVGITALTNPEGQPIGFAKVTRDLTERRQAEQERARRVAAERAAERIDRLQVATAALAAASRPQHVAEVLADVGVRALGASASAIAFPAPEGESLAVYAIAGSAPATLQAGDVFG